VRHLAGVTDLTALSVDGPHPSDGSYAVRHRDGRAWRVALERRPHDELPESCGKAAVEVMDWVGRLLA
jgi:hypothetical protein